MDREITITVTDDEARRIEERVASGEFESAAEYVRACRPCDL
jgi:Arc/MetJ-type ribon-helix-helix transcriptional regulator